MKSKWRVSHTCAGGVKITEVYRLKDTTQPDHSGNREVRPESFASDEEARDFAKHLNAMDVTAKKAIMPWSYAATTNAETIRNATQVTYDMEDHILRFFICEECVLECEFERSVSGTTNQLVDFYTAEMRRMFPDKRKEIKLPASGTYHLIRE